MSCPFCGSKELRLKTPFLEPVTHEPKMTFCCKAQAANHKYIENRFSKTDTNTPSIEEVSKW